MCEKKNKVEWQKWGETCCDLCCKIKKERWFASQLSREIFISSCEGVEERKKNLCLLFLFKQRHRGRWPWQYWVYVCFEDAMRHRTDRSDAMSRVTFNRKRKKLGWRNHFLNSSITIWEGGKTLIMSQFFYICIHFTFVLLKSERERRFYVPVDIVGFWSKVALLLHYFGKMAPRL